LVDEFQDFNTAQLRSFKCCPIWNATKRVVRRPPEHLQFPFRRFPEFSEF
jgi:hypothetical protein